MLGSDEGIKLGLSGGKVLGTILGNVYVITLDIDIGTYLGYLDGSLDGYNYVNIEILLLKGSRLFTDRKVIGSDEGIKLRSTYGEVIGTILGNIDVITLGLDVVTGMGSL